jgi:toxin ParE1/3/4
MVRKVDGVKIVWLSSALTELDRIHAYISCVNPKAARQVFLRIQRTTRHLSDYPNGGRPGHVAGTRELVVSGLPYLVVYRVTGEAVEILRVLHTAMDRGPGAIQ